MRLDIMPTPWGYLASLNTGFAYETLGTCPLERGLTMQTLLTIVYRLLYVVELLMFLAGMGLGISGVASLGFHELTAWFVAAMIFAGTLITCAVLHFVFILPIGNALNKDDVVLAIFSNKGKS